MRPANLQHGSRVRHLRTLHLDERPTGLVAPIQPDVVIAPDLPAGFPWDRMAELYAAVADAVAADVAAGGRPVVISGDCTTALGVVAGVQRAGVDPALVWFDAHSDVHTPETSASGYLGGMPVRQVVGGADRTVPDRLGLRAVAERDVLLVGAGWRQNGAVRLDSVPWLRARPTGPTRQST